jgi:hypothetical protein
VQFSAAQIVTKTVHRQKALPVAAVSMSFVKSVRSADYTNFGGGRTEPAALPESRLFITLCES